MKTFKQLLEDIEITDKTGKAYSFANEYINTYKDSYRPVPKIINKKPMSNEFTLRGPDEQFVADMINKRGRFKEGNNE